jgi:hypothetical protein
MADEAKMFDAPTYVIPEDASKARIPPNPRNYNAPPIIRQNATLNEYNSDEMPSIRKGPAIKKNCLLESVEVLPKVKEERKRNQVDITMDTESEEHSMEPMTEEEFRGYVAEFLAENGVETTSTLIKLEVNKFKKDQEKQPAPKKSRK